MTLRSGLLLGLLAITTYILCSLAFFNWLREPIYDDPVKIMMLDRSAELKLETWLVQKEFIGYRPAYRFRSNSDFGWKFYFQLYDFMALCEPIFRIINGDKEIIVSEIDYLDGLPFDAK